MARSLLALADRMEALAAKISAETSKTAVNVATAILRELVYVTPVDTSAALSNWQVGIGEPPRSELPPYYPGSKGSTRGSSAQAAFSEGVAEMARKKPGEKIYISNNSPYIRELNDGSSRQAPAGFVERAEIVGKNAAKQGGE